MLNTKGKKVTLLAGVGSQGAALVAFGYCDKIPASQKYVYFGCLVLSRMIMGFGNGCIQSATSSIIAYNFPDSMGALFGIQNMFT